MIALVRRELKSYWKAYNTPLGGARLEPGRDAELVTVAEYCGRNDYGTLMICFNLHIPQFVYAVEKRTPQDNSSNTEMLAPETPLELQQDHVDGP